MSAIANIAVYDGAATPVLHTLVPVSVTRDSGKVTAEWRENIAGVPVYAQIGVVMTLSKSSSGVYKSETRVSVPVMETVSGQNAAGYTAAPKVAYVNTVVTTGFFHERSDSVGRKLARGLAYNVLNNNSGTATFLAANTGPENDLIDNLVAPT